MKRDVGKAVLQSRRFAGMTQKELGDKIGKTKQAISRIENGHIMPSLETTIKIAGATGVTPDSIVGHQSGVQDKDWLRERVERLEKSIEANRRDAQEIMGILNIGESDV